MRMWIIDPWHITGNRTTERPQIRTELGIPDYFEGRLVLTFCWDLFGALGRLDHIVTSLFTGEQIHQYAV
jgi:hypothetical protein